MYIQTYVNKNVLDAALERMSFVFDNFENITVSISGGKDSTVLAHIALLEAKRRGRRIGLFFFDEEMVYESTVQQVEYLMDLYPENTIRLWLQIEFELTNATSLTHGGIICWKDGEHKTWMRSKKSFAIQHKMWSAENEILCKYKRLEFYAILKNFENCYKNTAFLVGLRAAGESINRFRTMVRNPIDINGHTIFYGTKKEKGNAALYPLYDWNFHDIWKYIYENGLRYNRVYDWQFMKGMGLNEMRVSSLIHEKSFKCLCELPEFEPKTYERLCKRVKGVAFAQDAGRKKEMFRVRKLPKNFQSWLKYKEFLLLTYPDQAKREYFVKRFRNHYQNEYVARQECRQLILNDFENSLPIDNRIDPREQLLKYYREVL